MKKALLSSAMVLCCVAQAWAADPQYKITSQFKMPNGGWDYATSDLQKNLVYWVRSDHTDVIDGKTNKVTSLKSTGDGHMATVVEGTDLIVVPMRKPEKTARIVDIKSDSVVADLPAGVSPDGAVYDPFSKHVFVVNHTGGDVTEIDLVAKKVVNTIAIGGGKLEFPATDGLGHVFVNVQAAGEVAVIDVKAGKLQTKYKMAGCEDASGLAYATDAKLIISSCGNGTVRALTLEGKEVASLPIGEGPDAVIYDPKHKIAFVPCGESGSLEILDVADAAHVRKIQTLKTPPMARTGAVDADGRLYMMIGEPDPTKPRGGGNRLPPKPDTFQMVVISR